MGYAEVCVNSPVARRRTFSYAIPLGLNIEVGQAVWVPFGDKILQGIVIGLSEYSAVEETRDIAGVIDVCPLLSAVQVQAARWISEYYLAPLFDAVALMLPPGFERKVVTYISSLSPSAGNDISSLTTGQSHVFGLLRKHGRISLKELEKDIGKKQAQSIVAQLVKTGLAVRSYEPEPVKVKPKTELYLGLSLEAAEARNEAARLRERRAFKQAALLDFMARQTGFVSWQEARRKADCEKTVVDSLVRKGMVEVRQVEVRREPISYRGIEPSCPLDLSAAQESALEAIKRSLLEQGEGCVSSVFLLHGVTGSGKTEVYLQALAEAVKLGKRGIVLVPEIALTPQTIERFAARFPDKVAVLHSRLSLGEQFDEWRRIRDGDFDVVIGSRSAVFAPQPDLGLIVLDEEHEWTYKQQDSPRYHTRNVAIKLAELTGATVVLGSATPDVETFYRAQQGEYKLLELPDRITPEEAAPMPQVEVVDLREELKSGNRSIFSRALAKAIAGAIDTGGQVILFLNRRGGSTFIQCRNCGFVIRCRRCEVPLTYHMAEGLLACHQCNYRAVVPNVCPRCHSRRIKFLGIGTEKLEQETGYEFPQARLLRWDRDVTRRGKDPHGKILGKFRAGDADILIGTQMVAKGLDLPTVTVVGVVNADTGLNLPDFRAGERTFQLLSQVAGRAGRGVMGGKVIIQTYSPGHYSIQAAAEHDYTSFYNKELGYRRQLHNPPFTRLVSLVYSHTSDVLCRREAERMKRLLAVEIDSKGIADVSLIGPAPAFIRKLRGRFRWQLILRGSGLTEFLEPVPFPQGWTVDIDPLGLA